MGRFDILCKRVDEMLCTIRFALGRSDRDDREVQRRIEWFIMPLNMKKVVECPMPTIHQPWVEASSETKRAAHVKMRETFTTVAPPPLVRYYDDLYAMDTVFSSALRRRDSM